MKKKNKKQDVKYNLTVTKKQAQLISKAMEFYARIHCGQFWELRWCQPDQKMEIDWREFDKAAEALKKIIFPDLTYNASYGVGWSTREGDGSGDMAWDLYQVVRHRLSWDDAGNPPVRDWKTMNTVNFNEPMKYGSEPLAEIEKVETPDAEWDCVKCGNPKHNCVCSHGD